MPDSDDSSGDFYPGPAPHTSVVPPGEDAAKSTARLLNKRKEMGRGSGSNSAGASAAASMEAKEPTEVEVASPGTSRTPHTDIQVC